ncbi:MAG: tetratricopeptide repeat protein [Candidatus Omnitrophica bacterium]|nr:tetratricopeptide repeat protein [Candidatus Omnitrophota bacterium]
MDKISQQDLTEFYNKGAFAFEKKNYDYAIEIFSQILSSKYDHLEARRYLHLSLRNKIDKASLNLITNIINTINSFFVTLSAEGMSKKGNLVSALELYEKIITKNPYDTNALKKISELFYKNDLFSQAIQNLEEAKSIYSKDVDILKRLGEIYLKKGDYKNAKSNYEAALKINPHTSEVLRALKNLDALGTIQEEFGKGS